MDWWRWTWHQKKRKRKRQTCWLNPGKESEGLRRPFVFSLHKKIVVTLTRQLGENKKPKNKSLQNKNCVGVYTLLQLRRLVYLLIIVPIQCRLFTSCIESAYFPFSLSSCLLCFAKHFPSCEKKFFWYVILQTAVWISIHEFHDFSNRSESVHLNARYDLRAMFCFTLGLDHLNLWPQLLLLIIFEQNKPFNDNFEHLRRECVLLSRPRASLCAEKCWGQSQNGFNLCKLGQWNRVTVRGQR